MMSAHLLRFTPEEKQGRFYHKSGEILQKVIDFYGRTLKVVLRYQTLTLFVALGRYWSRPCSI
jgi:multidrug efflux pump